MSHKTVDNTPNDSGHYGILLKNSYLFTRQRLTER